MYPCLRRGQAVEEKKKGKKEGRKKKRKKKERNRKKAEEKSGVKIAKQQITNYSRNSI